MLLGGELLAQNHIKDEVLTRATADSSYFAINKQAGWQQYSCHIAPINTTDSVMIEMIIQHDKSIDWKLEQYIGKIKSTNLLPKSSQLLMFDLLTNIYKLRIEPNGNCYIHLFSGSLPDSDPIIIPIRFRYKQ